MKISVVIPTYNRVKLLERCLDSMLVQTKKPVEVIVVDNGTNNETKDMVMEKKNVFERENIRLLYIKNNRENSVCIARNIGVTYSSGNVVAFVDDDAYIDKNHYAEIAKVYIENNKARGVAGITSHKNYMDASNNLFRRFFFLSRTGTDDSCKVLPSHEHIMPLVKQDIISCEWLHGCSSYLKTVLCEIPWDEKLKKYCCDDDTDLSYRVFKKYPGSLFLAPAARIFHAYEGERQQPKERVFMRHVYSVYLFYKNIDQTLVNKFIFIWSKIGYLFFDTVLLFKSKAKVNDIVLLISAYVFCMRHLKEMKRGDLDFFNKTLT